MANDIMKRWLEGEAKATLRAVGIKPGQWVLDFGCRTGAYTIPAAEIVGRKGWVYAIDKDKKALCELMQRAQSAGLGNIERMDSSGEPEIDRLDESMDVVFLYDVIHLVADRKKLFAEVYRVLKPRGFVSISPRHLESEGGTTLKEVMKEIEEARFDLEDNYKYVGVLFHDGRLEEGQILNFRKRKPIAHPGEKGAMGDNKSRG